MSTDYGLRCTDCGMEFVPDNMRLYAVLQIKNNGDDWKKFIDCFQRIRSYIHITNDYGLFDDQFMRFLEFLSTHYSHAMLIVNEYGQTTA